MDVNLLTQLILILAGIVILLFGGDFLVRGAVALARRLGIAPLIVGLTIVAFGTSAPEMVVSAIAAIQGAPGIAIGNIVGSNIANILLVLGLPAILAPMATAAPGVRTNALIAFGATLLFIGLTWDRALDPHDGMILAALIVIYVVWLAIAARRSTDDPVIAELTDVDNMEGLPKSAPAIAGMMLIGLVFLPIGAQLIVSGGGELARALGVSEAIIGLTLIALGTSLPELATAAVAALRRHAEMAIGNVIGSNIFNLFAVGGIAGVATAIGPAGLAEVDEAFFQLDYWVMTAAILAAMAFVFLRRPIGRLSGLVLFTAYCGYIGALAWRSLA